MTSKVSADMDSSSLGLSILGASSSTCFDWHLTRPIDVQTPYNRPTVSFANFGSNGRLHTTGLGRSHHTTRLCRDGIRARIISPLK